MGQITLTSIAERAGISLSTVSRVINGRGTVRSETAERVKAAAAALGYEPRQPAARAMRSELLGLVVPDLTNPFFSLLVSYVAQGARLHGYATMVASGGTDCVDDSVVTSDLLDHGARGVIWIPSSPTPAVVEACAASDVPVVLLDRNLGRASDYSVTCNNRLGAHQATKYLLKLSHRRILYLGGPVTLSTEQDRRAGHVAALAEHGVDEDPDLVLHAEFHQESAYEQVTAYLSRRVPFTAIFATDDVMAFGAMRALSEAGLRVPADVSLVGFDDIPFASAISLTTVAQPVREMAWNAFHLLLDVLQDRISEPTHIVLRPSIVIRSSCGARKEGTDAS